MRGSAPSRSGSVADGAAASRSPRTWGSASSRRGSLPPCSPSRSSGARCEAAGLDSEPESDRVRDRRRVRHGAGSRSGHVSSDGGGDAGVIRSALDGLVPYEPGSPVEEVQRELGLERVVKLASNEGPYGPVRGRPGGDRARDARAQPLSGRRCLAPADALAERHGVAFEQVTVCAGADAVVGYRRAWRRVDPGDEVVTGWPSFPSYVLDPAEARRHSLSVSRSTTSASISTRCSLRSRRGRSSCSSQPRTTRPGRRTRAPSSMPTSSASRRTC